MPYKIHVISIFIVAKTIFILESDEDVQDIMQCILEDSGYRVQLTNSEVISLNIQKVKPDLIILDDWFAKNDPGFCKKLKNEQLTANVPVILTTTQSNVRQLTDQLMVDDVLPKPFDLEDLIEKVEHWLKKIEHAG